MHAAAIVFFATCVAGVQQDDPGVVEFLLSTEIIPLSLRIMEVGTDLSRTVSFPDDADDAEPQHT